MGKTKRLTRAQYFEQPPEGFDSVTGVGRRGPDYTNLITLESGAKVPFGKYTEYDYSNEPMIHNNLYLQHNEYIVYDTSQLKMRYLIHLKR